jgi:cytochrome c556
MKFTNMVVASLAIGLSSAALAQSIGKAEDQIRWRQSAYHTMAWNMGRIKANIEGTYNKDQVIRGSQCDPGDRQFEDGCLYPTGNTNKGKGWKETRVKGNSSPTRKASARWPRYWKEANEMAKVAATGDLAAIKAQFGKLGEACKACHDKFRKED